MNPIQLTKELVSINSVNPFKTAIHQGKEYGIGNEEKINDFLENILKKLGFEVEKHVYQEELKIENHDGTKTIIPRRWNVLAKKGNFNKSVLFLAHTDTVDVKEGWECDPFIGEEKLINDELRFYGLGSNDMKAGIAAIISACTNILPDGFNLKIAFVTDEEYWSYGAAELCNSEFIRDIRLALVPEMLEAAHPDQDTTWLGLGRLGRAEFLIELEGSSCHGADAFIYEKAINAVHESAIIQSELIKYFNNLKNCFIDQDIKVYNSAYINHHQGGKGILSVPDSASFIIDRCLIPGETIDDELQKIKSFIEDKKNSGIINKNLKINISLRPRPTPACEPYFMNQNTILSKFIISEVLKVEKSVSLAIGRSVADENRIANLGIPTYIIPPRGEGSHTSEEWVGLKSIERMTQILKNICTSEKLKEYI